MGSLCGFPCLPAEIRHQIWLLSVPDDQPEICLPWPINVPVSMHGTTEPLYTLPCQPLTVDVAFPVAMHVCRESRRAVQGYLRFRASEAAGCATPFRRFRPELDVLFLGDCGILFMDMLVWPECSVFDSYQSPPVMEDCQHRNRQCRRLMETLCATRRFAVAAASMPGRDEMVKTFFSKVWACAEPPKPTSFELCFVVPTTKDLNEMSPDDVHVNFVPPGRRCRLASVDKCDWGGVLVPTDTVRSKPLRTLEAVVTESVKGMRAAEERRHIDARVRFPGPDITDLIEATAGTFVEYQRDGTWTEVCADRMYNNGMMILEIPPEERPDPEVQRVYDVDVELRLARWDVSDDETEYSDDE